MQNDKLIYSSFQNLKISLIGLLANSTIFFLIFYHHTNTLYLLVWYGSVLLISVMRYISWRLFNQTARRQSMEIWHKIFTLGVVLSAATWGAVSFLFFPPNQPLYQLTIIVITAGLSAGAITTLSFNLINIRLFLIIAITPLIAVLILQNSYIYYNIAALVLLYLVLMLFVAKQLHKNYAAALHSKQLYQDERKKVIESEQNFKTIFENVPIGIIYYDTDLVIKEINDEFANFLEAPRDYLIGLNLNSINDTRILPAMRAPTDGVHGHYEGQYITTYANKTIWVNANTSPMQTADGKIIGGIGIVQDVTQKVLTQQHIEHQAQHDSLTDLPNRAMIKEYITREINRFKRNKMIFAVVFLDLDHFKNINDSLGHSVGDELLIQFSLRIQKILRDEDIISRIGGDEFVILLPDLSANQLDAATKTKHIITKIKNEITKPLQLTNNTLHITSSIGIALMQDGYTTEELLQYADIAMYEAKKHGRNDIRFYQDNMDKLIKRRLRVENLLRDAVKNNELEVHYQPIIDFSSSNVIGAEALLRWHSRELGSVFPDEFIQVAEDSGIILEIGEWVLRRGVEQFIKWRQQFSKLNSLPKIAVNVSVKQFNHADFLKQIGAVLSDYDIKPGELELEVVESVIINDMHAVSAKMKQLRELGVSISIDDFGTGYSSLSYLKKLPFTTLKIDKSFTQDIQQDNDDKILIDTILTIADKFNLRVIAEGVETYDQYIFLKTKHCSYFQGYYCAKPMNADEFAMMLKNSHGKCALP